MLQNLPVFRFAPSPNGELHLGHAYSALLNLELARKAGGKMLLRIEDIDEQRCTPALEKQMLEDLEWVGFEWDEPPLRQSECFDRYRETIEKLDEMGVLYPTSTSRGAIRNIIAEIASNGIEWPVDPDGSPHYPGNERDGSKEAWQEIRNSGSPYALRLAMTRAVKLCPQKISWRESLHKGEKTVPADLSLWGDIVLARKEIPASYHICCVVDDAAQSVTHVVRGMDLYHSTSIHRLLQILLGLPEPYYHHHELVLDPDGRKLSKSNKSTGLRQLRDASYSPEEVRRMVFANRRSE